MHNNAHLLHDLDPRLVDVTEALCLLRQLLRDVSADEHRFEVDPQVLDGHPVLNDLCRAGQLVHPLLDLCLERHVVPDDTVGTGLMMYTCEWHVVPGDTVGTGLMIHTYEWHVVPGDTGLMIQACEWHVVSSDTVGTGLMIHTCEWHVIPLRHGGHGVNDRRCVRACCVTMAQQLNRFASENFEKKHHENNNFHISR